MMLTYALGGSRAWKCWMISFFAFTLDPILSYQCVCVGLQTSSTRPWDVLGLVISESSAEEKKREAESARDLKNRAHETVLSQLLSAVTVMFPPLLPSAWFPISFQYLCIFLYFIRLPASRVSVFIYPWEVIALICYFCCLRSIDSHSLRNNHYLCM